MHCTKAGCTERGRPLLVGCALGLRTASPFPTGSTPKSCREAPRCPGPDGAVVQLASSRRRSAPPFAAFVRRLRSPPSFAAFVHRLRSSPRFSARVRRLRPVPPPPDSGIAFPFPPVFGPRPASGDAKPGYTLLADGSTPHPYRPWPRPPRIRGAGPGPPPYQRPHLRSHDAREFGSRLSTPRSGFPPLPAPSPASGGRRPVARTGRPYPLRFRDSLGACSPYLSWALSAPSPRSS